MLTYPPDSLPQIICPMEEDAIPPNSFCSAPPHSEPQPPLLPLSSVTPSCEDDGKPSKRRSRRIQGFKGQTQKKQSHKDRGAAQRPSRQNPSSTNREREGSMVQVSQSLSVKLLKANTTTTQQQQRLNKDSLDLDVTECLTKHKTQKDTRRKATLSTTKNVDKQSIKNSGQDLVTNQSDMVENGELVAGQAVESSSSVKGWVIGPLFQSFKSKMASFTEIVMSPVRLFKPSSPPPSCDHPDEVNQSEWPAISASSNEPKETRETLDVQGQMENGNKDSEAVTESEDGHITCTNICSKQQERVDHLTCHLAQLESAETGIRNSLRAAIDKHSVAPKFMFDADLSSHSCVQKDECVLTREETNANDSVPFQCSPLLRGSFEEGSESSKSSFTSSSLSLNPSDHESASQESKMKMLSEEQNVKTPAQLKPPRRKRVGNRSSSQKCSSKILPYDVSKIAIPTLEQDGSCCLPVGMAQSEPNDEQFSQMYITETKVSDSFDHEKSQSLPSSVDSTPPDTLCQADNGSKRDNGLCVRKSPQNTSRDVTVNESPLRTTPDTEPVQMQQEEWDGKQDTLVDSAVRVGKAKRRLKLASQADTEADLVKRKRPLRADKEGTKTDMLNMGSDQGILTGLKQSKNEVVSRDAVIDIEMAQEPTGTKVLVSKSVKGRGGQKRYSTMNEAITCMVTEKPSGTMIVSSIDHSIGASENSQGNGNDRGNTSGSNKRVKKRTSVNRGELDTTVHDMNLETTMMTTFIKEANEEQLTDVLVQPLDARGVRSQPASKAQTKSVRKKRDISPMLDVELSQISTKFMKLDRKPLKRKSRKQELSTSELGSTLCSNSSDPLVETLETAPTDIITSQLVNKAVRWETGLSQPTKMPKRKVRGSVKSPGSDGTVVAERSKDSCQGYEMVTEGHFKEDKAESSSVQPELEPVDDDRKAALSPSRLYPECYVHLNVHTVKHIMGTSRISKKESTTVPPVDETIPTDFESTSHSQNKTTDEFINREQGKEELCADGVGINAPGRIHSTRRLRNKSRRAENQRRKCRVIVSKKLEDEVAEETSTMIGEEMGLAKAETISSEDDSLSRSLLRSYSCPEIPSLLHRDTPWSSALHSPQHTRVHTSHQHQTLQNPPVPQAHKSPKRARRHTVCSVEIEREFAPLCLRKEVYPSRRSASYGGSTSHLSPNVPFSPSTSLSALASRFLSSPLAFLSKKLEHRGAARSSSVCSHVSSPSSPSVFTSSTSPSTSSLWLPFGSFHPRTDTSATTLCSSLSQIPLESESETRQQSKEEEEEEEEEDGEDTSCSSQEFEDLRMREEKSLSDSEIKVVNKHEERGKVSSIRIRKALPKPQNNLTPMGLPRPIRVKKKEFSLEEIYTNKNFAKPPEGRLETIFELPLSRRNGSESHFGQRRMKRFVEFQEVGVVRKPKKTPVGAGKAGTTSLLGRPRRGGYLNSKEELSINMQELDSLLCNKLDQLDLWLKFDQENC